MLCCALSVAGGGVEVPADAGNGGCCEAAEYAGAAERARLEQWAARLID